MAMHDRHAETPGRAGPVDRLLLPRPLAVRLLSEALQTPNLEVCGFIAGRDGKACGMYPVANVAKAPATRFLMAADQQIAAMKSMRRRGEDPLAVYHSHPSAPAEPSLHDIEGLGYPEALVLIISHGSRGVPEMRAWKCDGTRATEVPLVAPG